MREDERKFDFHDLGLAIKKPERKRAEHRHTLQSRSDVLGLTAKTQKSTCWGASPNPAFGPTWPEVAASLRSLYVTGFNAPVPSFCLLPCSRVLTTSDNKKHLKALAGRPSQSQHYHRFPRLLPQSPGRPRPERCFHTNIWWIPA